MSTTSEKSAALKKKTKAFLEQQNTTDREVFLDMDKFEMTDAERFNLSIRIQFPKFSKGFNVADFETFINSSVGVDNVVSIGRLSFPNEWQMQLKNKEAREKLIRLGRTKINTRSCWISPLSHSEIRGFVHWIPNAIGNNSIEEVLRPFGDILFIETLKHSHFERVQCDTRYFGMKLKNGKTMDDIPHFMSITGHKGLVTVKGRRPICFHCKEFGHRKNECKKYREKLGDYCNRKPNPDQKRLKPRGRRFMPSLTETATQAVKNKRKKHKKKSGESQKPEDVKQTKSGENVTSSEDTSKAKCSSAESVELATERFVKTMDKMQSLFETFDKFKAFGETIAAQPEKIVGATAVKQEMEPEKIVGATAANQEKEQETNLGACAAQPEKSEENKKKKKKNKKKKNPSNGNQNPQ